jgi:zinc protease
VTIIPHPGRPIEDILTKLDEEITNLQNCPPPRSDVERAVKQAQALFAYGSESITNQAFWLGFAEMFANYEWFENYLDRLAEVTPEDVSRVAQTYILPKNRVVGVYLPTGNGDTPA